MTEIICSICGYMVNHMTFHNGIIYCPNCNSKLGRYCVECREQVCENCHLWEHVEQ